MAYYFKCMECNFKQTFNYVMNTNYYGLAVNEGKKQPNETVICDSCISKKTRLKGNHIIINRSNNNANI